MAVAGLMAVFALTFVIFFNLLGGSFTGTDEETSPSPVASATAAATEAAEWTPTVRTEPPRATRQPQQHGGNEESRPARTPAPAEDEEPEERPEEEPETEAPEPETDADEREEEDTAEESPATGGEAEVIDPE